MIVYHAYRKDAPVFYIGKTIHSLEQRRREHENEARYDRDGSHFHKALKKYGFNNFEWVILEHCETIEKLNNAEIRWIKLLRECGHDLYNIADGGDGGVGSDYWKGKNLPERIRNKISDSLKEYFKNNVHPRKGKTCIGHLHSDETKKKISNIKRGHEVSIETREKLRKANIGKKLHPHVIEGLKEKFKGKNNPSAKPIICLTTGEQFEYAKLAAIKYGIDLSSIIKCCKGKVNTVHKMKFKYLTPQGGGNFSVVA